MKLSDSVSERIFLKKLILKKDKKNEKLPSMQRVKSSCVLKHLSFFSFLLTGYLVCYH